MNFGLLSFNLNGIVGAVILLILAFIVAAIAKSLVTKLLNKTKLKDLEDKSKDGSGEGLVYYLGKLTYLIVFLLFVPGICTKIGVDSISTPIITLLNSIWGYLPNIIAAIIILVAGTLVAKLVRELLVPVFKKIKIDELQEKAGIEVKDEDRLSTTLAYIVYVIIIIPVIIAALEMLKISVISTPAVGMLQTVLGYIPNIVAAIVLILVGTRIGKFAGNIVKRLIASGGLDKTVRGTIGEDKFPKFVFSDTVGLIVSVVIDIFFIVQGVSVLKLAVLDEIGTSVIAYLPNVLAAALILIVALIASSAAASALEKNGLKRYGIIVRVAILTVAAFMLLNQLGIALTVVNTAFIVIISALAVAFAIAFGIGGRDFAKGRLKKLDDKIEEISKKD